MSHGPTGLGVLAVDVAARLTASGVLATTSIAEGGLMEVVVHLDPHRQQVAAITVGRWSSAVVHTVGEPSRVAFDVMGDDACTLHPQCLTVWLWGWVVRHRGSTW